MLGSRLSGEELPKLVDLSSNPQRAGTKLDMNVHGCNPSGGEGRQVDPGSSLASRPC